MSEAAIKELDWYLRDHLFRQSNAGNNAFRKESLPGAMISLYLRYRNADLQQLSQLINPVVDSLVARKVLNQEEGELMLRAKLTRLQCAKCFYVSYLAEVEPRVCLRCQHKDLHHFPKKKA